MSLEEGEIMSLRDWRKALRTPPAYRVVNRTLRSQTQFVSIIAITGLLVLIILYVYPSKASPASPYFIPNGRKYNYTYPLSAPIKTKNMHTFRIGIIADLDTNSKSPTEKNVWYSYLKKGYLSYSPTHKTVVISWDRIEPTKLTASYALKGRGMELSELLVFDGRLLTFDDRTGMIFEIENDQIFPWVLLMDGDGRNAKGFKSEWATVKEEMLFVGSMGKEWTTAAGDFENYNPMYVKAVTPTGQVNHVNWVSEYKNLRKVLNIEWPGYMIHESGAWSEVHKKWFFLPRRCSKFTYNESLDEHRGCSVLLSADSSISNIKITQIPNLINTRGFSSFKFIPASDDNVIVALRTEELDGKTATYITSFTIHGEILLEDTLISDLKYEGLEFI